MPALTTKEHLSKHDREIDAIRKLIKVGMRIMSEDRDMMREIERAQREIQKTQQQIQASQLDLQASQRETDRQLQLLIRSLKGAGTNGHSKGKADIQ